MADDTYEVLGNILQRLEETHAHVILDADGIVLSWGVVLTALFGWTAEEMVGQSLVGLVIPPALHAAYHAGLAVWREQEISVVACKRLRTTGQHKDGSQYEVLVSVQAIKDAEGLRFLGWILPDDPDVRAEKFPRVVSHDAPLCESSDG